MRKSRFYAALLACLLLAVIGCGCGRKQTESTVVTAPDEQILRDLFDQNLECAEIFERSFLPMEENPVEGTFYKITDDRFHTFGDLEKFTKSVFVQSEAARLLGPRYEDRALYRDVGGVLCIDASLMGGRGYYVDWTDYRLEILSTDKNEVTFKVIATVEWPAEVPVAEPYEVKTRAVMENGEWRLTELIV